ncbi:BamA/TamA family outer membrane protein [Microcoleus sp. CAWBG58]|uniref:BamA/TamA family outer membrane protein n=1 Tax=Microcoleus sp. CAWBG58 TaxID=2841651 RepID=UPI0025DA19D0|nr:BamA/TamA family outer membrane protein [Microcoleus sp. CAWBG58]
MRIPIIAFLSLAAVAGGELAGRAIDRTVVPTEVELREGATESQRVQRDEDEVIGDELTSNPPSLLFVAESRSPLTPLNKGGTRDILQVSLNGGGTTDILKVPLIKGDLGGSRLDNQRHLLSVPVLNSYQSDEVSLTAEDLPKSDELAGAAQLSGREAPSLKSDRHKDFTSLLATAGTIATKAEIPEAVNGNAQQLGCNIPISQGRNVEGVYVAEVKIRFVNSQGEAVDKKGNPIKGRTSEDFIRGELKLKAGDNYSQQVVRSDLQQLQQLGLFDKVTVSTEEVGTDINVIYNVQERSARSVGASVTLSDDVGVAVPLSYVDRTFGTNGQRLSLEIQPSLRGVEYDVQFVSPYVAADDRLGYSVRAFGDRRISEIFDKDLNLANGDRVREIRIGGNLAVTRPLGDWRGTLALNYTNISTRDRNLNLARRDVLGNPLTFSGAGVDELYTVSFGATLDRRNNPFNPTSGSILSLSTEQSIPLGRGNIASNRLLANYIQYIPVTLLGISESEALPEMLAFNVQGGTVIGDLPPTEAFRLGGRNSVRGYDGGEIGSGRSYFLASGEYRFPVGRDVGGVIFVDFASDLGTGDSVLGKPAVVRDKPGTGAGVGLGVRVRSSLGLIRLDMGVSDDGDIKFVLGTKQRF